MSHPLAEISPDAEVGIGTLIWRWTHVCADARIGKDCTIGEGVHIGPGVVIGDRVRIQNGAQIFEGVTIGDDAFIGPNVTFTNVHLPRARARQKPQPTWVGARAMIGAGAVIVCPVTIGEDAVVGAGAVVTRNVDAGATVVGNPARRIR